MTSAIDVEVRVVRELYGADVQLRFDPAVLEVVDADDAVEGVQLQLDPFLDTDMVINNVVDNDAGTTWYALTQLNPSPPRSGDGRLFSLLVRRRSAGAAGPSA